MATLEFHGHPSTKVNIKNISDDIRVLRAALSDIADCDNDVIDLYQTRHGTDDQAVAVLPLKDDKIPNYL